MEITLSLQSLARPILTEMTAYNWERWMEYDGMEHTNAARYEQKIRFICEYISSVGILFSTERDTENGLFSGIILNGERFDLDFFGERQRYLDRYHPGEKAVDYKAPPADADFDDSPLLFQIEEPEDEE